MRSIQESVLPETMEKLQAARSLANRPRSERFVPWQSIGQLLDERAAEAPHRPFLAFHDEQGRAGAWTRQQFVQETARAAAWLSDELGIGPGDRVATLMANDPRTVFLYFAAWTLGATVVPVNCGEDDERVAYILRNAEARAALVHEDQLVRAESLRTGAPVEDWIQAGGAPRNGFAHWGDVSRHHPAPLTSASPTLDTECLIVYTSGTTGPPKGVALDQYDLLADAWSIADWHQFGPDDRAMCVLPIHHVNGTVVTLMTPMVSGGSVVLSRRFSAQRFWRVLAEEQCSWVSVVPTVLAFLCERGEDLAPLDLSRFRHFICGAGPLTVELARRFEEMFRKRIVHGYGLSETTCYSCFLPVGLPPHEHRRWMTAHGFPSIGCPLPVNEMAIQDPQGRDLPPGERGEIVIRGHNVMMHYFRRPEANRDAFAHGWFRSGDEGFYLRGEDGRPYFFITSRLKELIIRGGVNYSPFEIDEVLNRIPGVRAAMAIGFEHSLYGEEIGAYVQREEGSTLTEEDVLAACRAALPFAKRPKVVVFGEEFPVTSTGKYQRNRLKPLFERWRDTRFRE